MLSGESGRNIKSVKIKWVVAKTLQKINRKISIPTIINMGAPSIKNYSKPRPVWMIAVGDTFMYLGQLIAGVSMFYDEKAIAIVSLIVGTLGYFFTKLYARIEGELIRQELTITTIEQTTTVTDIPQKEN